MNKIKNVIGIDVSKDTFDVYDGTRSAVFTNDSEGFEGFKTWMCSTEVYCVMEVTGVYHKLVAHYLHSIGATVSVVNPLIIKRYIQMKLHHNKTDKSDAKVIYKFGEDHPQKIWQPSSQYVENSRLIYICINQYNKQSTALKNKLHSLKSQGVIKGALVRSVNRTLKHLVKEKQALEKELEKLVKVNDAETLTNLMSIPGLGKKTALLLLVSLDGFRDFESPKQVSSYLGSTEILRSMQYGLFANRRRIRILRYAANESDCMLLRRYFARSPRRRQNDKCRLFAVYSIFPCILMFKKPAWLRVNTLYINKIRN